tara:strand:- start:2377 stop:2556 length:180 start_codon:yes stop_codon:yes gene_type:complete
VEIIKDEFKNTIPYAALSAKVLWVYSQPLKHPPLFYFSNIQMKDFKKSIKLKKFINNFY